ncbi:hypothetical protein Sm713_43220 [Streptomyces sp. TS71-3]|nr:hypothetical protein Sm713_43220 [Streptomyces sp. TS71-3]
MRPASGAGRAPASRRAGPRLVSSGGKRALRALGPPARHGTAHASGDRKRSADDTERPKQYPIDGKEAPARRCGDSGEAPRQKYSGSGETPSQRHGKAPATEAGGTSRRSRE